VSFLLLGLVALQSAAELEGWIAESRQVILAPVRELSVR